MTISSRALAAGLFGLLSVSAASAADLYVDVPVAAPVIVDDVAQWDGPYVGIFGGYLTSTFDMRNEGGFDEYTATGWLLGVNAGFDHTLDGGLVVGVVGDAAWTDARFGNPDVLNEANATIDWTASLRARAGFDGGAFLPYLTGGLALANVSQDNGDVSDLLIGWTVGAGVEIAATDQLSVDLQYRYSDYGPGDFDGDDDSFRSHQVTAGLNWRF